MKEISIRHVAFALLLTSALSLWLALFGTAPAHAVGTLHPFCLQGNDYPGLSYCTYDSYEQCMATASGRLLYCVANPFFTGRSDDPYAYQNRFRAPPPGYRPYR